MSPAEFRAAPSVNYNKVGSTRGGGLRRGKILRFPPKWKFKENVLLQGGDGRAASHTQLEYVAACALHALFMKMFKYARVTLALFFFLFSRTRVVKISDKSYG